MTSIHPADALADMGAPPVPVESHAMAKQLFADCGEQFVSDVASSHGVGEPVTACCGQFGACTKPCTPRGRAQVEAERHDADIIRCVPGYASLADVLNRAFDQAARGKGAERHAQGQPFDRQPMQDLIRLHGIGFATGQASKKAQEAHRLPRDRAVAELLGAINYLAGAIIAIEAGDTQHTTD